MLTRSDRGPTRQKDIHEDEYVCYLASKGSVDRVRQSVTKKTVTSSSSMVTCFLCSTTLILESNECSYTRRPLPHRCSMELRIVNTSKWEAAIGLDRHKAGTLY